MNGRTVAGFGSALESACRAHARASRIRGEVAALAAWRDRYAEVCGLYGVEPGWVPAALAEEIRAEVGPAPRVNYGA